MKRFRRDSGSKSGLKKRLFAASIMGFLAALGLVLSGCSTDGTSQNAKKVSISEMEQAPQVAKFVLGPGDKVTIAVWRNNDLSSTQTITPSGQVHCHLAGDIQAAGMSIMELKDTVTEKLSHYLVNPQVAITVESYVSQRVFVLGEVNRPGVFPIAGSMNAIEAISAAQGFTLNAAPNSVVLVRKGAQEPQLTVLKLGKAIEKGALQQNVMLAGGDVVYVPSSPIADVERFFIRFRNIILPIVTLETGIILEPMVENALNGEVTRAIVTTGT
jgi:polysaccharide export outer membrane protein